MPTSGDNTSASWCKPVAGTVDETRTPAMPVGILCSEHVRLATGITGFQSREEVKFRDPSGGSNTITVSILEKDKLTQLAREIEKLVFADADQLRHEESMDMAQKQYTAQTNSSNPDLFFRKADGFRCEAIRLFSFRTDA